MRYRPGARVAVSTPFGWMAATVKAIVVTTMTHKIGVELDNSMELPIPWQSVRQVDPFFVRKINVLEDLGLLS
jgi:hypothetical protein